MKIRLVSSALVAGLLTSVAAAQSTAPTAKAAGATPGWRAFAGCWQPTVAEERASGDRDLDRALSEMRSASIDNDTRICVIPMGPNGVEMLSFKKDSVTERSHLEADGRHYDVAHQGCAGWVSASFSADSRRLYMSSEQNCAGGVTRKTSGLMALTLNGQWLHIVGVSAQDGNGLRVGRYNPVASSSVLPADIASTLDASALSDHTARVIAQATVSNAVVIEASKFLSTDVMSAWLAELNQQFSLDARALVQLADAKVDPKVIDVMVAVSNPQVFAVQATGSGVGIEQMDRGMATRDAYSDCYSPMLDPWGYTSYDPCDPYHRYGYYGALGYGVYDPYYNSRYGRYGSYNPYYNGVGTSGPVTIIVRGNAEEAQHGRMTKGGYSRGSSSSTGGAKSGGSSSGASTERSPQASDPASSSGSTSSSGSSSGSSSSGSSGRTATRKPPVN